RLKRPLPLKRKKLLRRKHRPKRLPQRKLRPKPAILPRRKLRLKKPKSPKGPTGIQRKKLPKQAKKTVKKKKTKRRNNFPDVTAKAGTEPTGFFTLGYISKTKGLKGAVHLKIEAGQSAEYEQTESVFLEIKGTPVPFFVLSFRPQPDRKTAVLLLEDVATVEKARELTGKKVLLPASARKAPEPE